MEFVIVAAIVISFVLIVLLRGGKSSGVPYQTMTPDQIPRLGELPQGHGGGPSSAALYESFKELSLKDLEVFCRKLLNTSGLTFKSIDYNGNQEFHILSTLDKPILRGNIIVCGYLAKSEGVVDSSEIIGFSDMVKAERAMKGVFITNGYFSEEVMKLNEGAVIELVDVVQLARLMKELAPELLP